MQRFAYSRFMKKPTDNKLTVWNNVFRIAPHRYYCFTVLKAYKLASHFLPDLVNSQRYMPPAITTPTPKTKANTSIRLVYFNILFAINANIMVSIRPNTAAIQVLKSSMSDSKGIMIPITNPAKDTFDKSKKYPASFSLLTLFCSLTSVRAFCCSSNCCSFAFYLCCKYSAKFGLLQRKTRISFQAMIRLTCTK